MTKIISIHEYVLKKGVNEKAFQEAIRSAVDQGLLRLPGLIEHHMVKGMRGSRAGAYAAVWIYEDRVAWERLWGPRENPKSRSEYPDNWRVWEDQVLAPFLNQDPDQITYTAYEEW